jgi:hypothetical protein
MTIHLYVRPRAFPAINPNKDQSKVMVRSIVETLIDTIATDKIKEKKQAKEQYCRGIITLFPFWQYKIYFYTLF